MIEFTRYKMVVAVLGLLLFSYFALFNRLGTEPMHLWDESSYALNALEMRERGNPVEVYLFGKPDLYNSKPPLAIWCMAMSVRVLGFNELAVRLPSAMFGLFSAILLFIAGYKVSKDPFAALFASLVLVSSVGFIGEHIARTGDTDCILAFWILAQSLSLFLYAENEDAKKQKQLLFLTAVLVSCGCLTKGIAGLTALPGLFIWLLFKRKLKQTFLSPALYAGIGLFIILVPGYYMLRNMLNPGYLQAVWNFEIGGRLNQQEYLNPEYRPFYYFYQAMLDDKRLLTWIYVLPVAIGIIFLAPVGRIKELGLFLICALAGVSFSLGLSSTKLFWYDAPLYPLIAGVIGIAWIILCQRFRIFGFVLFVLVLYTPYKTVVASTLYYEAPSHFREFIRSVRDAGYKRDSILIINAEGNFPLDFYAKQDEMKGYYSKLVFPNDSALQPGTMIITAKYAREVDMNQKFVLDTLMSYEECQLYKIVGYR
jgi:4-amino-4-deoxy-L-arabinose transferase-like glycosyltransferase